MNMSIHTAFFCVGLMFDEVGHVFIINSLVLNSRLPSVVRIRRSPSSGTTMQPL